MILESIERLADIETPSNPFPGLRPFEFHESYLFFGREGQGRRLIEKLSGERFLAVVGSSGSGKSSLVRAGLLPDLYGGMMKGAGSAWRVALMRPGNDPIGGLARALNSPDAFGSEDEENRNLQIAITNATLLRGNLGLVEAVRQTGMLAAESLIIIADQFEELFRVGQGAKNAASDDEKANDKAAFVKLLLEAASQRELNIYVVLTMRSDYLGECAQFQDLPEAINECQYLIPRMTRDQRRQAIAGPVAVGGAEITPRLVNRLLNDVGDNPDQLPILQHALMRTWDEWERKTRVHAARHQGKAIDLCCYEMIGGMAEALSLHADEAYGDLPDERGRRIAERMFKLLTEKGADNRETRRPTTLGEISAVAGASESDVIAVIEKFRAPGRSFLTPPAETGLNAESLIDISHESLIRNWKRLNQWVDEETGSARIYLRLAETAALHKEGKAGLWRDPDLQIALDWREQGKPNQDWANRYNTDFELARCFLEQSQEAREAEFKRLEAEALEKEEEERRKKSLRRTRIFSIVLFALSLSSMISTFLALRARREVERQKADVEAANLNALEQKKIAEEMMRNAVAQANLANQRKTIAEDAQLQADAQRQIAENQTLMAEKSAKTVKELLYVSDIHLASSKDMDNDRKIKLLETYQEQSDLRSFYWYFLWRQAHNGPTTREIETTGYDGSVLFVADNKVIALSYKEGQAIKLWNVLTDQVIAKPEIKTGIEETFVPNLSPDGRILILCNMKDGVIKLLDLRTNQPYATIEGYYAIISPDGKTLAYGGKDNTIKLRDMVTGATTTLGNHKTPASALAFSSDGKTLASGHTDSALILWDLRTGKRRSFNPNIYGREDSIFPYSMTFSPNGMMLTGSSADSNGILLDLRAGQFLNNLVSSGNGLNVFAFAPDGKTLALCKSGSHIHLMDMRTMRVIATCDPDGDVISLAFTPDGRTLVAGCEKFVKLWSGATDEEVTRQRNK
jgi:WD40 repeat protein/energy-coupling factor transporter ATP-binding protein EcfA2